MTDEPYDSVPETRAHQARVSELMEPIVAELRRRGLTHDESKMHSPEVEVFNEYSPKLRDHEYGSEGYYQMLREMAPALSHHFANNDRHPQHHPHGVAGMDLLQLIEMLVDWKASSERNPSGSMKRSLEINKERFSIPGSLMHVLWRTARNQGWLEPGQ
jgi:hypothetical protein